MTQIAFSSSPLPLRLELGSALRLSDEELLEVCARNPELRIERSVEGDLVVMTPAGGESGHRSFEITGALREWARRDGSGVGFDSSTGFLLPNGAMRAPDASWVLRRRLDELPAEAKRGFLPLAPDFLVELRSPSDRRAELRRKMEEYREAGVRLGWLVDPEERCVEVYRPGRPVEVLEGPADVSADPELPGFVLELGPIWAPL